MDYDRLNYEYDKINNRGNHIPLWKVYFIALPLGLGLIFGPILFGPMLFGHVTTIVTICAILVGAMAIMAAVQHSRFHRLFRDSDIHTLDDDCHACGSGQMFGPGGRYNNVPPYVLRMAHQCRHVDDRMRFSD